MSNTIIMMIVTAVVVPFFAPVFLDALACLTIALMNKANGKPTWKVGTRFTQVVWPSGHTEYSTVIVGVTFSTIVLNSKNGYTTIKKRAMLKMICFSS